MPEWGGRRSPEYTRAYAHPAPSFARLLLFPQARFRALHFPVWCRDMRRYSRSFHACCILHNICIKMGDTVSKRDIATALELEKAGKQQVHATAAAATAARAAAAAAGGAAVGGGVGLAAGRLLQARLFYGRQKLCLPAPWNYVHV